MELLSRGVGKAGRRKAGRRKAGGRQNDKRKTTNEKRKTTNDKRQTKDENDKRNTAIKFCRVRKLWIVKLIRVL